jgi:hypothetical protein
VKNQSFFICDPEPVRISQAFADIAQAMRVPFEALSRDSNTVERTHRYLMQTQPENLTMRILFEDYTQFKMTFPFSG